jgi:hypothetical protein
MKSTENHDYICPSELEQFAILLNDSMFLRFTFLLLFFFRGSGVYFLDGITVPKFIFKHHVVNDIIIFVNLRLYITILSFYNIFSVVQWSIIRSLFPKHAVMRRYYKKIILLCIDRGLPI